LLPVIVDAVAEGGVLIEPDSVVARVGVEVGSVVDAVRAASRPCTTRS